MQSLALQWQLGTTAGGLLKRVKWGISGMLNWIKGGIGVMKKYIKWGRVGFRKYIKFCMCIYKEGGWKVVIWGNLIICHLCLAVSVTCWCVR
jgi:hypothetical protein